MNNSLFKRAIVAAVLLTSLCGGAPKSGETFVSDCADIVAIRSTVEEYVRTVKRRLARTSKEYMDIEDTYSRAAEAYERFVRALGAEAPASRTSSDAERETMIFIDRCRSVLRVDHLTDLEEPAFSGFHATFGRMRSQQKKTDRSDWSRAVQANISWLPWDRIR